MAAFNHQRLVIVQLLKIFLYQTVLQPVLTHLTRFAVCYQLVGIEGDVETEIVVNHHLEGFSFKAISFVLVNWLCFQIALRTETVSVYAAARAQLFQKFGCQSLMHLFGHIAQRILKRQNGFLRRQGITAVRGAADAFLKFGIFG